MWCDMPSSGHGSDLGVVLQDAMLHACVRVIWSSEPSGLCKGMGVSHDLEGLRCCGHGLWPSGCSADCNAFGSDG